jgi:hypothetical protein
MKSILVMNNALPKTKRDIRQKLFDKQQLQLFTKIHNARPLVQSQQSARALSSESRRLKGSQMQEERQQLIDCENRRMLFSISRIINRDRSSSLRHQHSVLSRTSSASSRKSLNEDHRRSEAARIRKENSFML